MTISRDEHSASRRLAAPGLALGLALGLVSAGCGSGAFRAPLRNPGDVLSGSDRSDRIALGALDVDLATDPVTEVGRLRRIASLELHVGNFALAEQAALRALRIARAYAALAPDEERARAESLHHEMRDEAIATADRIGSLELALEAVGLGEPGGARDVITRLVRARADAGGSLTGVVVSEALTRALDDHARLDFERLGAQVPGEALAIERLSQLGLRALPRLQQRLAAAARRQDTEEIAAIARAIRGLDRWDPLARAIGHLEDSHQLDLAIDLVGTAPASSRGVSIARLERARRADPSSAAIAIALAARCEELFLMGDALDQARAALALSPNDEERRTAELIAALAQTVDGEGRAFAEWERGHDGGPGSIGIARALAPLRTMSGLDEGLRARALTAARLLVSEGVGDGALTFEVASDPASPSDLRERALDALWVADRAAARIAAQCISERAERATCAARLDLLGENAWWEGLVPAGTVPDLDETSVPALDVMVGDGHVGAARAWVESAASRRLGIAPVWVRARIVLAARDGDVAAARALLASDGALLTAASRVVLAAWLDDLAASRDVSTDDLSIALGLGPALERFAMPPLDEAFLDVTQPATETERFVAADAHLAYDTWQADAPTHLLPLLDRATSADGAVIAGWIGAAIDRDVHERGSSTMALTPIAERAHALAPGTAIDLLLQALHAADSDGPALTRDAFARLLVLAPTEHALQRRWLAAWSEADPFAPVEEARARLLAIDPLGVPPAALTGEAAGIGDLLALYGVELPARHADVVMRAGPRMARADGAWDAIRTLIRDRMGAGSHADGGTDGLRALVEAARPSPERRRWRVALRILISDLAGAIDAADEPESETLVPGTDPPLPADDRLRALVHGRRELEDDMLWALLAEEALGDDAATLEALRMRALHRPLLDPLLCGELARTRGFAPSTMEVCLRSWRHAPDPIAAVVLSRAFVEASSVAWARTLQPSAFFEQAHQALTEIPSAVLHAEATVRERSGEPEPALAAEIDAEARGWVPTAWGADGPRMRRGIVVRAQRARPVAPRWAELAMLALGDARLVAAQLYADAAVASVRGHEEEGASTDLAYAARDLVGWAAADLAAGHIDAPGIAAFEHARARGLSSTETASLTSHYPDSALVAYAATVEAIRAGDDERALHWADSALRDQARPTLVAAIAPIVEETRGHADANAMRARAHDAFPDDPRIDRTAIDPVPAAVVASAAPAPRSDDEGCVLTDELAAAESGSARAAILRAAFRAADSDAARQRVLACTDTTHALATAPAEAESVASVQEPHAPSTAADRRRLAEEQAAAAQRAEAESQRIAEDATRRAREGEQRATEAEARQREAEARLAEAERRAAEAERRALEARPRAAAAEPTAEGTSAAELRAAEAERRVADAERRAAEADARAALAERTAIEEMRRITEASRRAALGATAAATTPVETRPAETPTGAADAGVPATVTDTTAEATATTDTHASEVAAPTTTDAGTASAAIAETATASTDAHATSAAIAEAPTPATSAESARPTESNVLYSPELPPPTPAELAARARALAAEADQRVAVSEASVASATVRAADAQAALADVGPRASHAETLVAEGEQRALEAETRAAEAERRAAEASHRLADVVIAESAERHDTIGERVRGSDATATTATEVASTAAYESITPPTITTSEVASAPLGGLGVEAVLDADPAAQRRGVELAARDPEGALAAARDVVLAPSPPTPTGDALPPFGKVQALVGLPPSARRRLAAELMNGSDRDLRLMALAAERVQPGTVDVDALRRTIESDDAGLAIEAVRAHAGRAEVVELAAMRTRLDAMHAPLAAPDRALAREIVHALAAAVDPHDRARIAAAPALTRSGLGSDAAPSDLALASAVDHDAALYLVARAPGVPRDPAFAPEAERIRRAHRPSLPTADAVRLLGTDSLARVLTGTGWRFVRLAAPSQFMSAMTGESTDPAIAQSMRVWIEEHGGAELGESGGLDGNRSIECAIGDGGPSSWVCVAHVRDRDRVRAALAQRPVGAHSAPWLPLGAAELARTLPMVAGATPLAIDRLLAAPASADAGAPSFRERAHAEVDLGGVTVERYATLLRHGDAPTVVDGELYLFTGDCVVAFGDEDMARMLLARPPTPARALSRAARFRRVTRGWTDGATLEIATLDWRPAAEMPLVARRDASIVLSPDAGGVVVTVDAPFVDRWRDVAPLSALLPEDAVSRFALAVNAPAAPRTRGARTPVAPPIDRAAVARLVLREAERIAFAWTPGATDGLWDHWVAIGEGPRLDAALAAAGITPPAEGTVATLAGTSVARRGTRWVIAPVEDDVRAALARPDVAAAARTTAMGSGRLDAVRGAVFVGELARSLPAGDARYGAIDSLGDALATAGELTFEASVERRALVLVTRVRPRAP
jgi:hypothetical protein